jgi:hypothetical protein
MGQMVVVEINGHIAKEPLRSEAAAICQHCGALILRPVARAQHALRGLFRVQRYQCAGHRCQGLAVVAELQPR